MIYIMGDIHGRLDRFQEVMRQINLRKEDHLYVLGDVIDRYPDGLRILRNLLKRSNVTVLLGNHEHMMLEALTKDHPNNKYIERWYNNGGAVTHRAWKHCTKAYREEMMEAIKNLPLQCEVQVNGKTYLLVHGAPKGCFHKYNDEVMDSVWGRIEPYRAMPKGKTVIFGHTPTCKYQHVMPMSIWYGDDKIGVDCGCAYGLGGRLACLRLDDMEEYYSSAIGLKKK